MQKPHCPSTRLPPTSSDACPRSIRRLVAPQSPSGDDGGRQRHRSLPRRGTLTMGTGFAIVFSIVGAILICGGLLVVRSSYSKMRQWTTVSGLVIGYREVQQGRHYDAQGKIDNHPLCRSDFERPAKWTAYDPQVQFTSADGKTKMPASKIGRSRTTAKRRSI